MPRVAVILLALFAPMLAGCFVSSDAFITPASADHPWGNLRARQFEWEGEWKPNGYIALRREGALYSFEAEDSRDVTRFLVKQIGDNVYVAQMQDASGSGDSSYT